MSLIVPPRLLLDTFAAVDLALVQRGANTLRGDDDRGSRLKACRTLLALLLSGEVTAAYHMQLLFEFCQASKVRALQLAYLFDSVANLIVIADDMVVQYSEILAALVRDGRITDPPKLQILCKFGDHYRNLIALADLLPVDSSIGSFALPTVVVPPNSVSQEVASFHDLMTNEHSIVNQAWQTWVDNQVLVRDRVLSISQNVPPLLPRADLVSRYLSLPHVFKRLGVSDDPVSYLSSIDWSFLPGVSLSTIYSWRLLRSLQPITRNDIHDLSLVSAIPYVDCALLDKRIKSHLGKSISSTGCFVTHSYADMLAFLQPHLTMR